MSKVKTIVAIGGGEIGREKVLASGRVRKYPMNILKIDREIVALGGKEHPKLLFLGTASGDAVYYGACIKRYFGELGCRVSILNLARGRSTGETVQKKILGADIIYVGGGDTKVMIDIWKKKKVDRLLRQAYDQGTVLSGLSAGAVCWFEWYDNSDYIQTAAELDLLPGLGILPGFAVPHYDILPPAMKKQISVVLKRHKLMGWAIDECAAAVFENGIGREVSARKGKKVVQIP
ncbi:MAG: Type 1 glutamine amidotransferase-like domain-containing protein [Lactobacillales bacterium]|jgi:dipeptidase E|nr:Type 1 glutamine amidotransferase-like domain-containing protein [Lactobacillales bacterium]